MKLARLLIKICIAIMLFRVLVGNLQARMCRARTPDQFYRCLNQRSLAVVLFYKEHRRIKMSEDMRAKFCAQMGNFDRMSKMRWFIDGDLAFVAINMWHDCMQSVADSYGVEKVPSYLLFKHGTIVRDAYGKAVRLTGFVARDVLELFIDQQMHQDLVDNNKQAAEDRALAAQEARLRYMYYAPYMYWGWPGWPYCGCYPGGYCGGFGGCGWGGCCGGRLGVGCCIGF